jgi:hypothetical protein
MDKLVFISGDSATVRERLTTMAVNLPAVDVAGQAQDVPGTPEAIGQTRPDIRAKEKAMTDKDEEKATVEEEERKAKKDKGKKDKGGKKKDKKKDKKKNKKKK